jgi:hypothetical protein
MKFVPEKVHQLVREALRGSVVPPLATGPRIEQLTIALNVIDITPRRNHGDSRYGKRWTASMEQ